eukprot:5893126-Lingulodinium_polyedra.AAC.1
MGFPDAGLELLHVKAHRANAVIAALEGQAKVDAEANREVDKHAKEAALRDGGFVATARAQ